jgi:hypothetical protein
MVELQRRQLRSLWHWLFGSPRILGFVIVGFVVLGLKFKLARQELHHLSHDPSPFSLVVFRQGLELLPRLALDNDLLSLSLEDLGL